MVVKYPCSCTVELVQRNERRVKLCRKHENIREKVIEHSKKTWDEMQERIPKGFGIQ